MTVKGIDVSSYQSETYSTTGIDFVFVKATEGVSYVNPKMAAQAKRARDAGLVVGFYHFLQPGDMKKQAAYFVEKAASREGDPLWADWETPGVSCADKDVFLAEVKRLRGSTHRVGLYCNKDYWTRRDTTSNAGDALWIAEYNNKPGKPTIQATWLFHQYTSTPIDTNSGAFASRAALKSWAQKAKAKPKPSVPKVPAFPGASKFGPGSNNAYVTQLGKALVKKGYGRFYKVGPGPQWGQADHDATQAFQRAQGWTGRDADGIPGKETWARLMK
ncbi:GH25 family lysozyme [Streptomyces sp. Tu6071]|uniref:GH25 family lysozyme n=1 Tax=Streptomyces sp. Tu6071 TaxID=355249 RepID=UPI00069AA294|nr:GH25 family lysozyme [Streptomyces sp. Tu6071]